MMVEIRRIDWSKQAEREELKNLRGNLSVEAGQVTAASIEMTKKVFGEPLSPHAVALRILDEVRLRGDEAIAKYTLALDGLELKPDEFRLDPALFEAAWNRVDDDFKEAVSVAKQNIEEYQRHILTSSPGPFKRDGVTMEMVARPMRRVGVYVPGGEAAYPSCALMDVIPAQVAGVEEIAVTTAPAKLNDCVLAAFHILGLQEVYQIGGATAIGMLAYGTETVEAVDMIVGAGNTFVSLAKRQVSGFVKIDMYAGPSEILVIADETADPDFVAADLLSQAEHYPGAAILVTPCAELIDAVKASLESQLTSLSREAMCRESLSAYGALVKVANLEEAIEVANLVAPEHLEIMTENPRELAGKIKNAGTVFLGAYTPEPAGDYTAGSSHTLPTGGSARFTSGLSALDFLKRITFIEYSREALARELPYIRAIANSEGLQAHARSAEIRFRKD